VIATTTVQTIARAWQAQRPTREIEIRRGRERHTGHVATGPVTPPVEWIAEHFPAEVVAHGPAVLCDAVRREIEKEVFRGL